MDDQDKLQRYLDLTYRYLSFRNRSEKEIRDYLTGKNIPAEMIETIVGKLYDQKFLDDEKFARSLILFRARLKPKGRYALEIELRQKGISKDIIEKAFSETTDEELPDEITQAKGLIASRIQKLQGEPRQVIYQKVGSFLGRRGYSWETAKKAIDAVLEESTE